MIDIIRTVFGGGFSALTFVNIVDILLTAFFIYTLFGWIKDTQAFKVVRGIIVVLIVTQLSEMMGFTTINYILKNVSTVGLIAVVVVFQPELRRTLERIGGMKFSAFIKTLGQKNDTQNATRITEQLINGIYRMSADKTGALIVIERESNLKDIIDSGCAMDCVVSEHILLNIFSPNTPLHDGAVVISNSRIASAGSILPLTQSNDVDRYLGTRHRSAIGLSERTDAVVIIVSEETGAVSYAKKGKIHRYIREDIMREVLTEALIPEVIIKQYEKSAQ
ncbi:MAG: TIGR00159 family protein [Eubacteriaceae bacterium]|nr:TIGR00159 family protein [Eubacteriaceae bacterium]